MRAGKSKGVCYASLASLASPMSHREINAGGLCRTGGILGWLGVRTRSDGGVTPLQLRASCPAERCRGSDAFTIIAKRLHAGGMPVGEPPFETRIEGRSRSSQPRSKFSDLTLVFPHSLTNACPSSICSLYVPCEVAICLRMIALLRGCRAC